MKFRTIIVSAAVATLAAGALISAAQGPQPCKAVSHDIIDDAGRLKLVGTASCKTGSVPVSIDGATAALSVHNSLFGAWLETSDGKPVSLRDVRD